MAFRNCRGPVGKAFRQASSIGEAAEFDCCCRLSRTRHASLRSPSTSQINPMDNGWRRNFRTSSMQRSWTQNVLKNLDTSVAKPYRVLGATEHIYKVCAKGAAYSISTEDRRNGNFIKTETGEEIGKPIGPWLGDFNLPATFSSWAQVTMLHIYLVHVRMRHLPEDWCYQWQQQMADHFFFDAEEKMDITHGITSGMMRQRYLKDLFAQWRGAVAAYDVGIISGDADLATAVWRNVFQAREDIEPRHLAAIVNWIRSCLLYLSIVEEDDLLFRTVGAFRLLPMQQMKMVDTPVKSLQEILKEKGTAGGATAIDTKKTETKRQVTAAKNKGP